MVRSWWLDCLPPLPFPSNPAPIPPRLLGMDELSRHLAYAEAGVSEIALESSWFFDRCVEPLGHIRLMLDLPRRNFGPFRP
jgi:hypothetical protein